MSTLSRVLKNGNKTKGKDIIISAGDSIVGSDNLKLKGKNIKHKSKKDNILECGGEHIFICGKNCDQNISGEHIYNCGKNCIQTIQGDHNSTVVGEKTNTAAKFKFGIASVQGKGEEDLTKMILDSRGLSVDTIAYINSGMATKYAFYPEETLKPMSASLIAVTTNTGGLNIANGQGVLFDNGTGIGGQSVIIANTSSTLPIQVYFTTKNGPYSWVVIDPLYIQRYVYVDVYNGVKKWTAIQPSKVFVQPELD